MNHSHSLKLEDLIKRADFFKKNSNLSVNDIIVTAIYKAAEDIAGQVIVQKEKPQTDWDKKIDDILTSRIFGFPSMMLLLGMVFWVTVAGANVPSSVLAGILFRGEDLLTYLFNLLSAPPWVHGICVEGAYRSLAWVVSVMLPPMAIFFPCFTLLEDLGYLPRVAFNLDRIFKKAGAHGKQALTMSMGFGCNAAGIVACRIIESPRERLIAMLTNNFVPCNGRFPTLIALTSLLLLGAGSTFTATVMVVGIVLLGIAVTLAVSWLLSKTILRGVPSSFTLELPPYRKPQVGRIIVRSVFDRTLFVLKRAVLMAVPAGAFTWLCANIYIADASILGHIAGFLDPFAVLIGLDGFILMAFILGLPANEIVLPILIMGYMSAGSMIEPEGIAALHNLFVLEHGWTWLTAVCTILFSLLHFPCSTTLWTIRKESGSKKWTLLAAFIPLGVACLVCFLTAQSARVLGLV